MTGTEKGRRSNSLYYDTFTTTRRTLCDMIANLESDLEESEAEADTLRTQVADASRTCAETLEIGKRWMARAARFESENAKLREFAIKTWELLTCNEPTFVWKNLQDEARELGVEI